MAHTNPPPKEPTRLRKTSQRRRSLASGSTELAISPTFHTDRKSKIDKDATSARSHSRSRSGSILQLHQPTPPIAADSTGKGHSHYHQSTSPSKPAEQVRTSKARLSPTERVYEDPDTAKSAFEAERSGNPLHRRAPTPYTSRARRRSQSGSISGHTGAESGNDSGTEKSGGNTIRAQASQRSLRSKVSFDGRSASRASRQEYGDASDTEDDDIPGPTDPQTTLGAWDPGFGATQGIGPAGEAIEVIGLGRKTPRHRIFRREMLKPALRSAMSSRVDLGAGVTSPAQTQGSIGHSGYGDLGGVTRDKPLPGRPGSIVSSVIDVLRSRDRPSLPAALSARQYSDDRQAIESPASPEFSRIRTRSFRAPENAWSPLSRLQPISATSPTQMIQHPPPPPHNQTQVQRPSLRSLFSSFSRNLNLDEPPFRSRRPRSPVLLRSPAENLYAYLAGVYLAEWRDWPLLGGNSDWAGRNGGAATAGLGWEWPRRAEEAARRGMRGLIRWEAADRHWERSIVDWSQQNVPSEPIEPGDRWGKQIFALPTQGFDTVEFHDEKAQAAGDNGLLSWFTGSLLQTAVSAVHMLRHSSLPFAFHLVPAPTPPYHIPSKSHRRTRSSGQASTSHHALWEGFGTLVSVHEEDPADRSLVVEIRPPSILTGGVMREFVKPRRNWRSLGVYQGDVGQANLLQSQNQVYYFVVTSLRYWVFGVFDSSYSSASVSPILHRKARQPSIMQCMTTWLTRSIDDRPQSTIPSTSSSSMAPAVPGMSSPSHAIPPYSSPTRSRSHSLSRSQRPAHSRSRSTPVDQAPAAQRSPAPPQQHDPGYGHSAHMTYPAGWQDRTQYATQSQQGYSPYPSPGLTEFGYPAYDPYSAMSMGMGSQAYHTGGMAGMPGMPGGYGYETWSPGMSAMPMGSSGQHGGHHGQQGSSGAFWYGSTGWGR